MVNENFAIAKIVFLRTMSSEEKEKMSVGVCVGLWLNKNIFPPPPFILVFKPGS